MNTRRIQRHGFLISLLLTLSGCSTLVLMGGGNGAAASKGTNCNIYVRTQRGEIPPLPVIDDNKTYTDQELAYLQAKHIRELREWIAREQQREDAEYIEYIRRCGN